MALKRNGDNWAALISTEQGHVACLIDFGPQKSLAREAFCLPLPSPGTEQTAKLHGYGVVTAATLPIWERVADAKDAAGNPVFLAIPADILAGGAYGPGGTAIAIPPGALPSRINLDKVLERYFGTG